MSFSRARGCHNSHRDEVYICQKEFKKHFVHIYLPFLCIASHKTPHETNNFKNRGIWRSKRTGRAGGHPLKQIKLRCRNNVPCSNTSVIKFWTTRNVCGYASVSNPKLSLVVLEFDRSKGNMFSIFLEHKVTKKENNLFILIIKM